MIYLVYDFNKIICLLYPYYRFIFMMKNVNWLAVSVVLLYPLLLVGLVINYGISYGVGSAEIVLFLLGYYITNISVGVGLHRLWSHNSFKTNAFVEFILAVISAGALQGPALSWASNHYRHHTFTDTEQDPHSPLKYENPVKGFLWSHFGWMLIGEGSYKSIDRVTMAKLGKNKILKWQLKYYWQIATLMNTLVPLAIGYMIGGTLLSAYMGFLFIGFGRSIQQNATFCVNSLCHFVGSQKYYQGTARDIWWMAIFILGENWHNFHHAFPSDYRNGPKWYQTDVHKWIIYLMSLCGLAWDLQRTPDVRVQAKITDTLEYFANWKQQKILDMQNKVNSLLGNIKVILSDLEDSSNDIKVRLKKTLAEKQNTLNNIAAQLSSTMNSDSVSDRLLNIISYKIDYTEDMIKKLYASLEIKRISN